MTIFADRGKSVFRRTDRELLRLSSGNRPEAVHAFRTSARRLQTLLEQLVSDGARKHKKLLKMLNRIRKSAGKVRDIDVQMEALRTLKVPQEPRRKTQLMQSLIELRAQHERKFHKLLKNKDIKDIRKRLRRTEASVKFESSQDPLSIAKEMLRSVPVSKGPMDESVLHRYRTVVKRARYAAEFAPKSNEAARYLAELKRMQDALGNWHDWLMLTHTAIKRLGNVNESSLVAVLYNVTRGKFRHAVTALTTAKTEPADRKRKIVEVPLAAAVSRQDPMLEQRNGAAA